MMKDNDFKLLRGFDNGQTDRQTDEHSMLYKIYAIDIGIEIHGVLHI